MPEREIDPLFDSPEERADAWARALHWGTPEQLAARGIEPLFDCAIVWDCDCGAPIEDPDEAWCNACLALGPDPRRSTDDE